MASTMTHVVTVVGFVLYLNCFIVSQSIEVGESISQYQNKTRRTVYQCLRFTKFDTNALRQIVSGLQLQANVAFADKRSVKQFRRPHSLVQISSREFRHTDDSVK
jgi:hypothetical protein